MPIAYAIDQENQVVRTTWTGEVTADDLVSHWEELFADPQALALGRSVVDLRDAELKITGAELDQLLSTVAPRLLQGRRWKTAVLANKPAQYGSGRQFEVLSEAVSRSATFHDYDEAVRWLVGS